MASCRLSCILALEMRRGRSPPLPKNLQTLIRDIAPENATGVEERIVNELQFMLAIRGSARTVGRYLNTGRPRGQPKSALEHVRSQLHSGPCGL